MKINYLELKKTDDSCIVNNSSFTSSSYLEFEELDVTFSLDIIKRFQDKIYKCNLLFQDSIKNLFKNNTIELLNKEKLTHLIFKKIEPEYFMKLPKFKKYFKTNYILPEELFQDAERDFKIDRAFYYYFNYGRNYNIIFNKDW